MNIHDSDIKLIFGVDCGIKPMDISYGAKPKIDIINKRCKNVIRLTSKWIRTLLSEALTGKKKNDNEEVYWLCEHTTILKPHKPNIILHCVKWDLTALHKKMKSTSLIELGFNDVRPSNVFANIHNMTPIEHDEQYGDNSEFSGERVDLNDSDDDINISFSSPPSERAIVVASTTQLDIIDMLVKENQKAWGIIRQWEAKYKHLESLWELRARVIADLKDIMFN
ncbi:hypothetical protein ACSBR2_029069 [Camellia fascicularis]